MVETISNAVKNRARHLRSPKALHVVVLSWLLFVSYGLFHQVFASGHVASRMFHGQRIDSSQQVWFLGYAAHLLTHPSHPFWSELMYAGQGGFNLLSQTSVLAIGLLAAPVTWLLGPLATANIATLLAPVATGYSMFLCLRVMTRSTLGQVLGATIFAFLPATVGPAQGGHLMVTVLAYPPLLAAVIYDLLVTQKRSPRRNGVFIGLLTTVQFFIGTEVLAMTAAIAVPTVLIAYVIRPRTVEVPWRALGQATVVALGVALLCLAYPLWFALAGPQHVTGPAWAVVPYAHFDVSAIVRSLTTSVGSETPGAGRNLNGAFLGWPLLCITAVAAVVAVRRRLAWSMVALAVVAWLLSLGRAFGSTSPWANLLPMRQLSRLPLFDAMLPTRFVLFYGFGVAVLVALCIDAWKLRLDQVLLPARPAVRAWSQVVLAVIFVAGLLPFGLTYSSLPAMAVHEPWWFANRAHTIPSDNTVLVYPTYSSLLFEAMEGFPFKTVGGYAIIPDAHGASSFIGKRHALDTFLVEAETLGGALEAPTLRELRGSQSALRQRGVDNIVILTKTFNAGYVAATMVALTGALPTTDHRVMIWSNLATHAYPSVTTETQAAVDACALSHRRSAAVAASCVATMLKIKEFR